MVNWNSHNRPLNDSSSSTSFSSQETSYFIVLMFNTLLKVSSLSHAATLWWRKEETAEDRLSLVSLYFNHESEARFRWVDNRFGMMIIATADRWIGMDCLLWWTFIHTAGRLTHQLTSSTRGGYGEDRCRLTRITTRPEETASASGQWTIPFRCGQIWILFM